MKKLYLTSFTFTDGVCKHEGQKIVVVTKEDRDIYLKYNEIGSGFDVQIADIKLIKDFNENYPSNYKLITLRTDRVVDLALKDEDCNLKQWQGSNVWARGVAMEPGQISGEDVNDLMDKINKIADSCLTPDEHTEFEISRDRILRQIKPSVNKNRTIEVTREFLAELLYRFWNERSDNCPVEESEHSMQMKLWIDFIDNITPSLPKKLDYFGCVRFVKDLIFEYGIKKSDILLDKHQAERFSKIHSFDFND